MDPRQQHVQIKTNRHGETDDWDVWAELAGCADRERSQSYDVSKRQAGNGHMINAASPDLSSKTCGSVRAHATDRRWKTGFDFHRRPGVGVGATGATGATGALLRDCHQNSWVIFKWPKSRINPFGPAWLNLCLRYTQTMGGKEKRERENYQWKPERLSTWSSNKVHSVEQTTVHQQ